MKYLICIWWHGGHKYYEKIWAGKRAFACLRCGHVGGRMSVSSWHHKDKARTQREYTRVKRTPEEKTFLAEKEIAFSRGWQTTSNSPLPQSYKIRSAIYHMTLLTEAFEKGKECAQDEQAPTI